jgi:DNA-cytosine methyltransferase
MFHSANPRHHHMSAPADAETSQYLERLRVGSDCSGLGTEFFALNALGVEYANYFMSEISENALKVIRRNHQPETLYRDITERDVTDMPSVDIYVAGPPCQSHSSLNCKKQKDDPRSGVYEHCLEYIEEKEPACFLLENVRGMLTTNKGAHWRKFSMHLDTLPYTWEHAILCPTDYGVPASRPRVWIVGIHKKLNPRCIPWPSRVKLGDKTCLDLIDESDTQGGRAIAPVYMRFLEIWGIPADTRCLIEPNSSSRSYPVYGSKAKPLTESQRKCVARTETCACVVSKDPGIMLPHLKRMASPLEVLRLQGFPDGTVNIPQNMTNLQFCSLVGNAFNFAVIRELLRSVLPILRVKTQVDTQKNTEIF